MNAAQTKYMKGNDPKDDNLRLPPFIRVDGVELEEMKEFVYFESLMTAANDTSKDIQRRILLGNRAFFGLHKTFRSTRVRPGIVMDQRVLAIFKRKALRWRSDIGCWNVGL